MNSPVLDGGERSGHEVGGQAAPSSWSPAGAGAGLEVGQGIGQEVLFGGQAFVLGRIVDRRGMELVDLEPEEVDFSGPGPFVASERCQLRFELRRRDCATTRAARLIDPNRSRASRCARVDWRRWWEC